MEKMFKNLFKPNRLIWQAGPEFGSNVENLEAIKKLQKLPKEKGVELKTYDVHEQAVEARKQIGDEWRRKFNELKAANNGENPEGEQKEQLDEWFKKSHEKINSIEAKYNTIANTLAVVKYMKKESLKKTLAIISEMNDDRSLDDIINHLNSFLDEKDRVKLGKEEELNKIKTRIEEINKQLAVDPALVATAEGARLEAELEELLKEAPELKNKISNIKSTLETKVTKAQSRMEEIGILLANPEFAVTPEGIRLAVEMNELLKEEAKSKKEAMPEGEADLFEMLSELENNALDFAAVAGDDGHIYARRNNDELYRSTPEKTTLEKAVVKDGKLNWEKVDDEMLLAAYNIKKVEEAEKPAEVAKSEEEDLTEKEAAITEKEKQMADEGVTTEKTDEINKLKEEADKIRREIAAGKGAKAEKPAEKPKSLLTFVQKKEICDKVREAVKSGEEEKIKKYFEISADGTVKFNGADKTERRKNEMAITLGTMFPNAAKERGDYVVVNGKKALFSNAMREFYYENGKRAIVRNGDKVQFVEGVEAAAEQESGKKAEKTPEETAKETVEQDTQRKFELAKGAAMKTIEVHVKYKLNEAKTRIENGEFNKAFDLLRHFVDGGMKEQITDALEDTQYVKDSRLPMQTMEGAIKDTLNHNYNLSIDDVIVPWKGRGASAMHLSEVSTENALKWLEKKADKEKYDDFVGKYYPNLKK